MACTDCGVRPRWPITGISASTMASITGTRLAPPSSFTDWAPARMRAAALRTASSGPEVVAEPGQVADDERAAGALDGGHPGVEAPGHGRGVMRHVVDGDLEGVVVAEHDHGEGVADQDQVGPTVGHHPGAGGVVGGDHHQGIGAAGAPCGRGSPAP